MSGVNLAIILDGKWPGVHLRRFLVLVDPRKGKVVGPLRCGVDKQTWVARAEPMTRRILASDLAIGGYSDFERDYDRIRHQNNDALNKLIDNLILEDEIVIPINDYTILIMLIKVLGERAVLELLDSQLLRFYRYQGLFMVDKQTEHAWQFKLKLTDADNSLLQSKHHQTEDALDLALSCLPPVPRILTYDAKFSTRLRIIVSTNILIRYLKPLRWTLHDMILSRTLPNPSANLGNT